MLKVVRKTWGHENWLVNTELYCLKELVIEKKAFCSLHYHKIKDETFYIKKGIIGLDIGDESIILTEGQSIRIPPKIPHRINGINDSVILEVSTHHEDSDSYRLEPSCNSFPK